MEAFWKNICGSIATFIIFYYIRIAIKNEDEEVIKAIL